MANSADPDQTPLIAHVGTLYVLCIFWMSITPELLKKKDFPGGSFFFFFFFFFCGGGGAGEQFSGWGSFPGEGGGWRGCSFPETE